MPYIITTTPAEWADYAKQHGADDAASRGGLNPVQRVAVATLDEAREHVHDSLSAVDTDLHDMLSFFPVEDAVPEQGGTIGPLPDGTIIEVRKINGYTLAGIVANATDTPCRVSDAVNRFNAR